MRQGFTIDDKDDHAFTGAKGMPDHDMAKQSGMAVLIIDRQLIFLDYLFCYLEGLITVFMLYMAMVDIDNVVATRLVAAGDYLPCPHAYGKLRLVAIMIGLCGPERFMNHGFLKSGYAREGRADLLTFVLKLRCVAGMHELAATTILIVRTKGRDPVRGCFGYGTE
ncbi:MAG: hypothetical protein DDT34_02527 [Firmicutes bacterium]|nr:hypothetical protein [Bacillota bacterium]